VTFTARYTTCFRMAKGTIFPLSSQGFPHPLSSSILRSIWGRRLASGQDSAKGSSNTIVSLARLEPSAMAKKLMLAPLVSGLCSGPLRA